MELTKEQMEDAAKFANFAQRVKMNYWEKCNDGEIPLTIPEARLDEVLLLAYEDLKGRTINQRKD